MNKVELTGRLVRDPEIRVSQGEKPTTIAKYSLAVDRKFKQDGQPTADFINCTALGKSGEFVEKYLHKGMKIGVVGHIQTGSYTNKEGQKVYTIDVMVEETEFLESKNNSRNYNNNSNTDGFMNIPDVIDEELPFN